MVPCLSRQFCFIQIQADKVPADHCVGEEDRVVGHIASPQVEEPGDLVQGADHMDVRSRLGHFRPDVRKFVFCGAAGEGVVIEPDLLPCKGGTVRPDFCRRVCGGIQGNTLLLQRICKGFSS